MRTRYSSSIAWVWRTKGWFQTKRQLAEAGAGLFYGFEPALAPLLASGRLRSVLDDYAATGPGFFLYFPSRTQVSTAFRAFLAEVKRAT
jgi:DNA-binding transcriptional LysR family regulator